MKSTAPLAVLFALPLAVALLTSAAHSAAHTRLPDAEPTTFQSKSVSRPSVSFYQEASFKGRLTRLKAPAEYPTSKALKEEGIGNDALLSMKVPEGVRVSVYDGDNFLGDSLVLDAGEHATLGRLAHRVSSMKIELIRPQ